MNYYTLQSSFRHLTIKTNKKLLYKSLIYPLKIEWSLASKYNKKLNNFLPTILFSYYSWNIIPSFKPNAKTIYITKLNFFSQPLALFFFNNFNYFLTFNFYNNLATHNFSNLPINFSKNFSQYSIYNKNNTYNNNNKLNFELILNSKFNLFGIFWFKNIKNIFKSKFLLSKFNLI